MPAHRQRSNVHEARIAGLAITLSMAALIFVVVYVIGGYTRQVVIGIVPAYGSLVAPSPTAP